MTEPLQLQLDPVLHALHEAAYDRFVASGRPSTSSQAPGGHWLRLRRYLAEHEQELWDNFLGPCLDHIEEENRDE